MNLDNFLNKIRYRNESELFFILSCFVLIFLATENKEMLDYMDNTLYGVMVKEGVGFTSEGNYFQPSVVEFGELAKFAHEDLKDVLSGKKTKAEAVEGMTKYFSEYIARLK